jgi:hypothetical protein
MLLHASKNMKNFVPQELFWIKKWLSGRICGEKEA